MKKKLALALAASMLLTMSLASCGSNSQPSGGSSGGGSSSSGGDTNVGIVTGGKDGGTSLIFTTGGDQGTYYGFGGVLAGKVSEATSTTITAITSGGSQANVEAMEEGDAQLGFVQTDVGAYAYNGTRLFEETGKVEDFSTVANLYMEQVQIVTLDENIKSVADLVEYAKKNPGKLNYASGGNGSAGHMAGEWLKQLKGIDMVHVPFAGAAAAQLSVLAGQTDLIFDNLASATANIQAGKLLPLAVTTTVRAKALPDVPTMQEAGVPNFDISTWYGLFVPSATPDDVVAYLNKALTDALKSEPVRARLEKLGGVASPTTPDEFHKLVASESEKYAKLVKLSGARVD